ncbi:MAG TPA: FAD-binding protein [Chloroflexota bacterium]|nr:FAD-binding protein [Chloroflexota bacterium]
MNDDRLTNWAGNLTYGAARVHRPETVEEVREIARKSERVRGLGARHSFNGVADTTGDLISLERMERVVGLDVERRTVTVEGGIKYGTLARALHEAGWAVANTASLPHITVAGACATATHGSGDKNGCLATSVVGLELVSGDGSVVAFSRERDGERFNGVVVGLGALGIVTRLTLDIVPTFQVAQTVCEGLSFERLERDFEGVMSAGYSVSLFTDWMGDAISQVWLKQRVGDAGTGELGEGFFGAARATVKRHPITILPADNCTEQLGVPGPWHERLPHFKLEHTPSSGAELQSEYFVERRHVVGALRAVRGLREEMAPVLQISEIRTVAADDLWMSPYRGRDTVAFHFTWLPDWPGVSELLPKLEAALAPFNARPHWGKLFTMVPERVRELYPRMGEFRALAKELDRDGKFRNRLVETYVLG